MGSGRLFASEPLGRLGELFERLEVFVTPVPAGERPDGGQRNTRLQGQLRNPHAVGGEANCFNGVGNLGHGRKYYDLSYAPQAKLRKLVVAPAFSFGQGLAMVDVIDRRRAAFQGWVKANGGVRAVAERAEVPATTLYSYLGGKSQSLKGTTQDAIAQAFSVSTDDLFGSKATTVPVVGYVQAGAEAVLFAAGQGPFDYVPAPEGSTENTVAVEIRGESLGSFFTEWLVFYDDVRSPVTPDLHNRLCVVGLPDDRILVKKIKPSQAPGLFHLLSQTEDPILDQEVAWAARVKTMSPR